MNFPELTMKIFVGIATIKTIPLELIEFLGSMDPKKESSLFFE